MKPAESRLDRWMFTCSSLMFVLYVANVVWGGVFKQHVFLSDIAEMLFLFASVGFFVFGTLAREAKASQSASAGQS